MKSEREVQARIMLALGRGLSRVFRNTVGVGWMGKAKEMPDGSVFIQNPRRVTFGLAPGSSDLIGWHSVVVTPDMVGTRVAIFKAVEVKRATGGRMEPGQRDFLTAVTNAGGIAGMCRSPEEAMALTDSLV